MRRKFTLPEWPPVAMMTPLRARILSLAPAASTEIPTTRAAAIILADQTGHSVLKKDLHARFPRGLLQGAHDADAPGSGRLFLGVHRFTGLNLRPCHDGHVHGPGRRVAHRGPAAIVGRSGYKCQSMGEEPVVGENVVVGESPNDVAVVEAVVGGAVGLHHGPVGEVGEEDIGRIHDSGLFLGAGAAAQRDVAAADGSVAADVAVGLDQDYRRVALRGYNGGGQPGSAGSDHHDVSFFIPFTHSRGGLGSGRQTS